MAGNSSSSSSSETITGAYSKGRFRVSTTVPNVAPMDSRPTPVSPSSTSRIASRSTVRSVPSSPSTPTNSRLVSTSSPSSSSKKDSRFRVSTTVPNVAPMDTRPAPVSPSSTSRRASRSTVRSVPSSPSTPTNSRLVSTSSPSSSSKKDSRFTVTRSSSSSPTAALINSSEARTLSPSPSPTKSSRLRNESSPSNTAQLFFSSAPTSLSGSFGDLDSTVTGSASSFRPIAANTNGSAPMVPSWQAGWIKPPESAPPLSASTNPFQSSGGFINSGAGSAQPGVFGFGTSTTPLFQPFLNTGASFQPQLAPSVPALWPSMTPPAANTYASAPMPSWQAGCVKPAESATPFLGSTSLASVPPYSYPFQPSGGFMNAGPGSAQPAVFGFGTSTTPLFQPFLNTGPTVQPQLAHPVPAFFSTPGPAAATPSSSSTAVPQAASSLAIASNSGTKFQSEITGLTVGEIIKKWNSELQEATVKFQKLANAIEERDKKILRNRVALNKLETEVAKVIEAHASLDRSLELIETHQNEADEALTSIEEQAESIYKDAFGLGFHDEDASRRDAMFGEAEVVNTGLELTQEQIRAVIQNVNANHGGEVNAADRSPLDAAAQILNNHLVALQSIDKNADELSSRLESLNNGHQCFAAGRKPMG